jgi:hypothetical protein
MCSGASIAIADTRASGPYARPRRACVAPRARLLSQSIEFDANVVTVDDERARHTDQ